MKQNKGIEMNFHALERYTICVVFFIFLQSHVRGAKDQIKSQMVKQQ